VAGLEGGEPPGDDSLAGFLAELGRWSAADRAGRAATERVHLRALVDRSAAEATVVGLFVDLAEAGAEVTVTLADGHRVNGRLTGVGRDLIAIERRAARPVLVRTEAIAAVIPGRAGDPGPAGSANCVGGAGGSALMPGRGTTQSSGGGMPPRAPLRPTGRRPAPLDLTLAAALDAIAGDGAPVALRVATEVFTGTVVACGENLVTMQIEGAARRPCYVPLAAVTCVELR
jgi:hypothetical protein